MPDQVQVASRTDVGRVRTNNEDNFLVNEATGLFVVADGMGGHNAGEVASQMACEIIQREMQAAAPAREKFQKSGRPADAKALRKALAGAVVTAGKEIFKRASKNAENAGMGCTCTAMMLLDHNKAVLAHIGDSRLFVLRNKTLHQLSEDHTFVNEMVKRGALTPEQAENHPQGNVLSRALGVQSSAAVDSMLFDYDAGDTFLLCSDGLYNYFPNHQELATQMAGEHTQMVLAALINKALERGGHDNTTGILVRIGNGTQPQHNPLAADRRIAMLKAIPLFSHLGYNELVKVVGLTRMVQVAAGTQFITEGDLGEEFYVVLSGCVDIIKDGVAIATLAPGAHIGEMAMVDNSPRSASVVAKETTHLLVMGRPEFFGLIRSESVIATKLLWSFVQSLSGRLRETNEALQDTRRELESETPLEIFIDDGSSDFDVDLE